MRLLDGEPPAGPWQVMDIADLVAEVLGLTGHPVGRPRIVVVDGRGASGKTTLAARIADRVATSAVVHADDLAWHEPFFGWGHLLRNDVLLPLHRGESVRFQPPAWERHGRAGEIAIPAGLDLVVIEGVGAGQRELDHLVDASIWVQSDFDEAERRGIDRDIAQGVNGDVEQTIAFWHEWMAHEVAFLADQRPWERAALVVAGSPTIPLDPGELAVARRPARPRDLAATASEPPRGAVLRGRRGRAGPVLPSLLNLGASAWPFCGSRDASCGEVYPPAPRSAILQEEMCSPPGSNPTPGPS